MGKLPSALAKYQFKKGAKKAKASKKGGKKKPPFSKRKTLN